MRHQSILAYARYRYLKLAAAVTLATIAVYEQGVETTTCDRSMVKKAVKCDMRKDLPHGPACISACPTGAALRVSPERFPDYTSAVEA